MTTKAKELLAEIKPDTKLGDLRKIAKEIKKDHDLALELWESEEFKPRLLAILIMDKKELSEEVLDALCLDMAIHTYDERNNLMDWLMANHLTKTKREKAILESWKDSSIVLQRRAFWSYQGRLRWTGKNMTDDTEALLDDIEERIMDEEPEVQWAMNFTAGWIGVYDETLRDRCVSLGEETELYKGDFVSKGCTPNYLPEFIRIETDKRATK